MIYGDSNVWGDNFFEGKRIPKEKQWVNILREKIKEKYEIFQEGLPGRTAGTCEKEKEYKNGASTFMATFKTCAPIDIVIIALGTNDLQIKYNQTSKQIVDSLMWYKEKIVELYQDEEDKIKYFNNKQFPQFIYLLPVNFEYGANARVFDLESETKRQEVIAKMKDKKEIESIVIDNVPLFEDGIHLNYEGHSRLADTVERYLEKNE